MKKHYFAPIVSLLFLLILPLQAAEDGSIAGTITAKTEKPGPVIIRLYRLRETEDGKAQRLKKEDIYGALTPFRTQTHNQAGSFVFDGLPSGYYSILTFRDVNRNERLDFDPPEALGWYALETGGTWAVIDLVHKTGAKDIRCLLRRPSPFPRKDIQTSHGALRWIRGLPVLQLWGTCAERGFAHGYLIGRQILDFFEFYLLEDSWKSPRRYQEIYVPFLEKNFHCPTSMLQELDAVIKGMKASGIDMHIDSLGRSFSRTDLLAINAYIEKRAAFPVPPASSCTQFAFWGPWTQKSGLKGALVAARNMDGECDTRKVTVSHFLLFAVVPAEQNHKRWISAMWPGFVGTLSGMNEEGLYSMENAGGTGPGPVVGGITPCSWVQRSILETMGKSATPAGIKKALHSFRCDGGGATPAGSILFWALPYHGQKSPAFVYEGDRFGGTMRLPGDVFPKVPGCIMASNHHLLYGCSPDKPRISFGRPAYFSSAWRYEAGSRTIDAWSRMGKAVDLADIKRLLQTVSHGTTEHSIIFLPESRRIFVAVDDLKTNLWDAPYLPWTELSFDQLFRH